MTHTEGNEVGVLLRRRCVELSEKSQRSYGDAFAHYGFVCPRGLITDMAKEFQGGFVERFPGETCHFYSPDELVNAEAHVPIDIRSAGIVPIADCKDNLFLCYLPTRSTFALLSAIDNVTVTTSHDIREILSKLDIT